MFKLIAIALFLFPAVLVRADDDYYDKYPEPCTFTGHSNAGTVSGTCATLQVPLPNYHSRWTLTLVFDAASTMFATQIKPDQFADMVRTQTAEDGTDLVILPLWGDLELVSTKLAYLNLLKATAPLYETRPNLITITQTSNAPYTLVMLFEEPADYLDLVARMPSQEWWTKYIESYYRLGTNRPTGFSGIDSPGGQQSEKKWQAPPKKPTP
jgi:hypothetical protein